MKRRICLPVPVRYRALITALGLEDRFDIVQEQAVPGKETSREVSTKAMCCVSLAKQQLVTSKYLFRASMCLIGEALA